jgi:hypothetical protein
MIFLVDFSRDFQPNTLVKDVLIPEPQSHNIFKEFLV